MSVSLTEIRTPFSIFSCLRFLTVNIEAEIFFIHVILTFVKSITCLSEVTFTSNLMFSKPILDNTKVTLEPTFTNKG